jgi:hypothetical protein
MDDRQPEKWLHLANLSFREACDLEENSETRVESMTRCNDWIQVNITDCNQLAEVAKGISLVLLVTEICSLFDDSAIGGAGSCGYLQDSV